MTKSRAVDRVRYSTGELARLVEASRNTIIRYIEEGRIRARRSAGGWYIIPKEEVLQFLWDLSFSKQTPLRMWRAATLAYEQLSQPAGGSAPPAKARPRRRKAR